MKVWFFYEGWKDSKGHRRPAYYAVTQIGSQITDGGTLQEAIYMAHDLKACMMDFVDDFQDRYLEDSRAAADEIEVPHEAYLGSMDIEVDLVGKRSWVRKGDSKPRKEMPMRIRTMERAFQLAYRDVKL